MSRKYLARDLSVNGEHLGLRTVEIYEDGRVKIADFDGETPSTVFLSQALELKVADGRIVSGNIPL